MVGALLTEAMVPVPMWRSLRLEEFFALHGAQHHRLYRFFAPPTAGATTFAVLAAVTSVATGQSGQPASVVAAACALVILSTYCLFFQRANASFAAASVAHEDLPAALTRWASWHSFRTGVGLIALVFALLAVRGGA